MSDSLVPKLKKIQVATDKLILDPNNPRLTTRKDDLYNEKDFLGMDLSGKTKDMMDPPGGTDTYRIREIENSIRQNGWLPIDFIFVKKYMDGKHFIVLEGNRRITAIRNILKDEEADPGLLKTLSKIEVMEIIDKDNVERKICYLLGVRHHGSLVKWTPFAQAHNILNRYLDVAEHDFESFTWNTEFGRDVANALSIDFKEVEQRLRVYRAMWQLGKMPEIEKSHYGIKDRYYSVCAELLLKKNNKINKYIEQDSLTFLLDDEGLQRFNNLCHFSEEDRKDAPIKNPQEWRYFERILRDEDTERKRQMLEQVEELKIFPSIVWAERAAELQRLEWYTWLLKVTSVLKMVTLGDDLSSEEAKNTVKRLVELLDKLEKKDVGGGVNNAQ